GLDLRAERGVRLRCGPATLLVVLAPDAESPRVLLKAPQLGGIVAKPAPSDGSWSTRWLIATWPAKDDRAHLALHGTDGRQAYYGHADVDGGGAVSFTVDAVAGRGTVPLVLRGTAEGGRVALTEALSSVRVLNQAAPAPE
ncbi:MAG: hypothetical protein M3389_15000, partial [Actinomycetota bacterium]|nr:hypothetical protein [Actinomycetota bacterium]